MAMSIGSVQAASGMSKAIYDQIRENLEGDLGELAPGDLEKVHTSWKKLAHAIATGVVQHVTANLEIRDVQTRGNVSVTLSGATATASGHTHAAGTLSGSQNGVTFTQVAGTGTVA